MRLEYSVWKGELGQIYKQNCTLNIGLFNVCWEVFGGLGCKIFLPIMEEEELRGGAGEGGGWFDSAHYHPHHLTFGHDTHISTVVPVVSCTQGMYGISSTFIATISGLFSLPQDPRQSNPAGSPPAGLTQGGADRWSRGSKISLFLQYTGQAYDAHCTGTLEGMDFKYTSVLQVEQHFMV